MSRIVTISFTPLDAPGGVPKFNRDLHAAFPGWECVHYSWWDFPWCIEMEHLPEWEKARTLNHYLVQSRKLDRQDVVIADGFWADGLQHMTKAVSHSHGIWSHLTKEDVDANRPPENPFHHAAQVNFRRRWIELRKPITAVSDFIANEMERQWGYRVDRVINNGVDTSKYIPTWKKMERRSLLVIHGVNDKGNLNKGWDHIEAVIKKNPNCDVLSLDEAVQHHGGPKEWILSHADVVVHPSGYEGNSMFIAESLACGVPVVGYDVGYLWKRRAQLGTVIDRTQRSPEFTAQAVCDLLENKPLMEHAGKLGREFALEDLSSEVFARNWQEYVETL